MDSERRMKTSESMKQNRERARAVKRKKYEGKGGKQGQKAERAWKRVR